MSKLWNSIFKAFRTYIGSPAKSETANLCCAPVSSKTDHKSTYPCKTSSSDSLLSSSNNERDSNNSDYCKHDFYWSNTLAKSIFLEICGLSSAVALGWEFSQQKCTKANLLHDGFSAELTKSFASFSVPSLRKTRFNINNVQSANSLSHSILAYSVAIQAQDNSKSSTTEKNHAVVEEINKTLSGIVRKLGESSTIGLGDWENSVGVELINSAANGTVSEYDHLITKHSKSGRAQAYRREAFLCFTEATNLGSVKGAYNLGICYEQGIGTAADVNKATACYEKAVRKNHPGAQYNLGLLLYHRYLNDGSNTGDLSRSFSLLRQAAQQGLKEASHALDSLRERGVTIARIHTEISVNENEVKQPRFRKAASEPHDFGYCSEGLSDNICVGGTRNKDSVAFFYLGD